MKCAVLYMSLSLFLYVSVCQKDVGIFVQELVCVHLSPRTRSHTFARATTRDPVFNFDFSSHQCQILNMLCVLNGCNWVHVLRWVTLSITLTVSDHIHVHYSTHGSFVCITMCNNVMCVLYDFLVSSSGHHSPLGCSFCSCRTWLAVRDQPCPPPTEPEPLRRLSGNWRID